MNITRINTIDGLRGLSCFLMFLYHFEIARMFILQQNSWLIGTWMDFVLGNYIRVSFLFIFGVSFYMSSNLKYNVTKNLDRAFKLMLAACLITLFSGWFTDGFTIYLGIIHHIFLVSLVFILISLSRFKNVLLYGLGFLGLMVWVLKLLNIGTGFFFLDYLLGLYVYGFKTLDYFPLAPWVMFSVMGWLLAPRFIEIMKLKKLKFFENKALVFVGRNALVFYMLHAFGLALFFSIWNYLL